MKYDLFEELRKAHKEAYFSGNREKTNAAALAISHAAAGAREQAIKIAKEAGFLQGLE